VDVVYDPVGGAYAEAALRSTAWGGRLLVIGFAAGEIPRLPLNLALLQERSILGAYWGEWTKRNRAASAAGLQRIGGWISAGKLRPAVTRRLRLEEVPQGLQDLLERRVQGKLVAIPSLVEAA
jgi:NADPH2:quinone reductase